MIRRLCSRLFLTALTGMSCLAAHATIIHGSFSGNISRIATPSGDSPIGVGNPVTGSFIIDTSYFTVSDTDESTYVTYSYFNADPLVDSLTLSFDYGAGPIEDDIGAQTIRLQRTAEADTIYLSNYYPKGYGSSITLVGDRGSLFKAFRPDAILVDADIDESRSRAYMGSYLEDAGSAGTFIALTDASLNATTPIPEPSGLAMAGLALMLGVVLRRRPNP